MITDWREKWNGGTSTVNGRPKPFLFVELAPYTEGAGEPFDKLVVNCVAPLPGVIFMQLLGVCL